jgi:hypothetical protein
MTSAFIFGYVFLSMAFFSGLGRLFTVIGPGKIILPTAVGTITMTLVNNLYLYEKALTDICS